VGGFRSFLIKSKSYSVPAPLYMVLIIAVLFSQNSISLRDFSAHQCVHYPLLHDPSGRIVLNSRQSITILGTKRSFLMVWSRGLVVQKKRRRIQIMLDHQCEKNKVRVAVGVQDQKVIEMIIESDVQIEEEEGSIQLNEFPTLGKAKASPILPPVNRQKLAAKMIATFLVISQGQFLIGNLIYLITRRIFRRPNYIFNLQQPIRCRR
jgi:hypothetical protein